MVDERYPAKFVSFRKRDNQDSRVPIAPPINPPNWFLQSKEEILYHFNKLIIDLEESKTYYKSWFNRKNSERELPVPLVIQMKDRALAKSHRPNFLLKEINSKIISIQGLGKIIISIDEYNIQLMIDIIKNLISKVPDAQEDWLLINQTDKGERRMVIPDYKDQYEIIHQLTAIEKISSYTNNDILSKFNKRNFEKAKKDGEIKLRFFNFNDNVINNMYFKEFVETYREYGLTLNQVRKINYLDEILTYSIPFKDESLIKRITHFPAIEYIKNFTHFKINTSQLTAVKEKVAEIRPDNDKLYPKLAIVDSGISNKNRHLYPWIIDKFSTVVEENQDNYHGEFVAGMILYSHILNPKLKNVVDSGVKILDVIVIPDSKKEIIREYDLLQALEDALEKYSKDIKVWNFSLGTDEICDGTVSEFTATLDYLQDKYDVIFVISAGNYSDLREKWPIEDPLNENAIDRITVPAESIRGLTVGAIALEHSENTLVKINDVVSYSRRGPGIGLTIKPDIVHYSGNPLDRPIKSIDSNGIVHGDYGTSFSTPLVSAMLAEFYESLSKPIRVSTAKALLIHGARHPITKNVVNGKDYYYFGYGLPNKLQEVLYGNENEITMIFEGDLNYREQRNWLRIGDFPFPPSLADSDKIRGNILLTLYYLPPVNQQYGSEYIRANVDIRLVDNSTDETISQGPSLSELKNYDRQEKMQMVRDLKWSPVKQIEFRSPRGKKGNKSIRMELYPTWRDGSEKTNIPFSVVVTIKDPQGIAPVYNEVTRLLDQTFISENIQIRYVPVRLTPRNQ